MDEIKKKRGRPPLSPELKAKSIKARQEYDKAYKKNNGYASQKKYRMIHKKDYYQIKVTMPSKNKESFMSLLKSTNKTASELFLGAIAEVYGVDFKKK